MVEVISQSRRLGETRLVWGDGEHSFALKIKQLIELQEQCGAGPAYILTRIQNGAWRVEDIRETLRLGLVGGGMKPADAATLVRRYDEERPIGENVLYAEAVLSAAIYGVPEDGPVGKPEAPPEAPTSTGSGASNGETISEPASL